MLYEQIRYAEEIRRLYKLRHLLLHARRPAIDALLGYPKNSTQFYRIKKALQATHVLDGQGRFVENPPNLWIAELALNANRAQTKALGNKVPYTIFLAATLEPRTTIRVLPRELFVKRQTVHKALNRLLRVKAVSKKSRNGTLIVTDEKLRNWLLRYIDLSKSHADATGDISYLFGAVPAHISGAAARYAVNYEPGRPIGPSDMVIATYKPFQSLWESLVKEVRYFKEYPKKVEVGLANPYDEIAWIGGIPYNKKMRRPRGDQN
jgi:hypothetical protein